METNKIECPDCQILLDLTPKKDNPKRLVAFHNCCGRGRRQVYETDAPKKELVSKRRDKE